MTKTMRKTNTNTMTKTMTMRYYDRDKGNYKDLDKDNDKGNYKDTMLRKNNQVAVF